MRIKADLRKFAAICDYARKGKMVGMFQWQNGDVLDADHHIITPNLDVETIFQNLKFHKGNRKLFEDLYNEILSRT